MPTPLRDLSVLEISDRLAGSYCGKLLRDAGAMVTIVEPPGGSPARRTASTEPSPLDDAPLFQFLNGGKRSVVVGADRMAALAAAADVVVLTATPKGAEALGLAVDSVHDLVASNPRAIVVTISNFGWTGPWAERPATEFTLQALCGATGYRGVPERPPVSVGGQLGEYVSGAFAAAGVLALGRRVSGGGAGGHLDVSMLECMTLAMQSYEWLHFTLMQMESYARSIEVPSIEPAKDGWVGLSLLTGQQWLDFAAMVEQPILAEDPELAVQLGRWPRREEMYELIHPWLAERTVDEVVELSSLFRLPVAHLGNGATIAAMDHFVARGVFAPAPSGWWQPRPPWLISGGTEPAPPKPAPSPGQHTEEVLAEASAAARPRPVSGGGAPTRPLAGLRVVDLTAFWAGPAATALLAGLGADVVKIESVQRPDGIRFAGGQRQDADRWWEYSWVFHGVNIDKRSVTLDLASSDGHDTLLELIRRADVVIENFSPRVLDDFELSPSVLLAANPAVVVVRMPAFGLDGPWRDRVGFAPTMEQLSGMAWLTGYPDGPPIAPRGACDPLAGAHAAFVVLAALERRDRTGEGLVVEVPMIEVALNVTAEQMLEYQRTGEILVREGNRSPAAAPQNVYGCAGEEAWIALAVAGGRHWDALRDVLGRPAWADDAELATHQGRRRHHDRLDRELAAWFSDQDVDDAVARLWRAGVPVAPVVLPPEVVSNEQLQARGFFETLEHPLTGCDLYAGLPFGRPDVGERWWRSHPPLLGEHNHEVLGGELGRPASVLEEWKAKHVIGDRPLGL
jgi:crotonobetainyl-CoA:carnitine CoA-transferase CaiB-like acyl-CoA transferase